MPGINNAAGIISIDTDAGTATIASTAANFDIVGGGGTTTSAAGNVITVTSTGGTIINPSTTAFVYDDFFSPTGGSVTRTDWATGSQDTANFCSSGEVNTNTLGRIASFGVGAGTAQNWMSVGAGTIEYQTRYLRNGNYATANTYFLAGWGNAGAGADGPITEGIYFQVTTASANFRCITVTGGVATNTDSGVANANVTWYKLGIEINAAGTSVDFLIDDVVVATNATNIPTGNIEFGLFCRAGGGGDTFHHVDFIYLLYNLTTPR